MLETPVSFDAGAERPQPARRRCATAEERLKLELPPRVNLLEPRLPRQGLAMVFARRRRIGDSVRWKPVPASPGRARPGWDSNGLHPLCETRH